MSRDCRCRHDAQLALDAHEYAWAPSAMPLRYWQEVAYAGIQAGSVARNYAAACRLLEGVCGVRFEPARSPSEANIIAVPGGIDGPWNVLALSEIPPGPTFSGVLHQTFDQAEHLEDSLMVAMFAHELGHVLGLGHLPEGNLMAPVLNPAITTPQAGDIAELQARYGPPALPPASPGPQTVNIEIAGVGTLALSVQASVECDLTITPLGFTPMAPVPDPPPAPPQPYVPPPKPGEIPDAKGTLVNRIFGLWRRLAAPAPGSPAHGWNIGDVVKSSLLPVGVYLLAHAAAVLPESSPWVAGSAFVLQLLHYYGPAGKPAALRVVTTEPAWSFGADFAKAADLEARHGAY